MIFDQNIDFWPQNRILPTKIEQQPANYLKLCRQSG